MWSKPIVNVLGISLVRRLSSEVLSKDELKVGSDVLSLAKEPLIQHGPSIKLANREGIYN